MADAANGNEDLKARMREALERKRSARSDARGASAAGGREKAHGPEVQGGGPRLHRRKAGGGGS